MGFANPVAFYAVYAGNNFGGHGGSRTMRPTDLFIRAFPLRVPDGVAG